jgi:hypothetical protein
LKGGKIRSVVQLRDVLRQSLFTETYTRTKFLEDLAKVTDAKNLERVLKGMTNPVYSFQKGALYEIYSGAWLQKVYGKVKSFREGLYLSANELITGKPYKTDIDIVLEGNIFVQVKAGPVKLPSDKRQAIREYWDPLIHAYKAKGAS